MTRLILLVGTLMATAQVYGEVEPHLISIEPCVFEAQGETIDAECGWIAVPETHFAPTDVEIRLPFVRFESTTASTAPPLIYLAGGPGGSGIGTAKSVRFHMFMKLRAAGDVIVIDQRGTGAAEPSLMYTSKTTLPLDKPMDYEAWTPLLEERLAKLAADFKAKGITLAHYNTRENAADIDALRKVLGLEKIRLWGTSYGTHLSTAILRYYGDHIDRVMLSGAEGPDHTLKLPSTTQKHLEIVADLVANDREISRHIPDFVALVEDLLNQFENEPVTVTVRGQNVVMGRLDLAMFISESLGRRRSIAPLPMTLYELSQGEYRRLANVVLSVRGGGQGTAMSYAMDCASGATPERRARIAREDKELLLGDAMNFPFDRAAEGLGVPDLGDAFRGPLESDVPVFFISGTLDGRTPIANAEELRQGFPNNYHLIIERAGHDEELFSGAPGLGERMLDFLNGKPPSLEHIVLPPVEFVKIRAK